MPKTVEYTGTQTRWSELATTGKQSTWMPGQAEERSDAEAVQLLGTGFFKTPDDTLTPSDIAGIKGVVPGDWLAAAASQAPTLFIASDSIVAQGFRPPTSVFGGTSAKGSYINGATNTRGVTNVYAENPARFKFRAAHLLVTGDEMYFEGGPAGFALTNRRFTVTITAADELTLDGIDGTALTAFTSAGVAHDGMAYVDMAMADFGVMTWALPELGSPFSRIDGCLRPGATSAQIAAGLQAALAGGTYTHGIVWAGRNDAAYDEASLVSLRDQMLAACGYVIAVITYPDAVANMTAGMLAKLKSIGDFWYAQQALSQRIRVCDEFGAISDPTATYESALPGLLASDGTHPQGNGALRLGRKLASDFPPITPPRSALSRVGSGSANLLTGGRFTATTGGVLGGVIASGACVANWSLAAAADRGGNPNGKHAQAAATPAVCRLPSTAYVAGDILDIGDGYWYLVKTGGTTAASLPAGYASAVMFDYATGVTDGTAVAFRVPKWTDRMDRVLWQYMDLSISADSGTSDFVGFKQSISLPGSVAVGDYVRAQGDMALLGGRTKGATLRLTASDVSPAQIARAHWGSISSTLTAPASGPIKARTVRTPSLRVPSTTATLEWHLRMYIPIEGMQMVVANPVLEKVAAPGNLA